jgi:hypothetical protein
MLNSNCASQSWALDPSPMAKREFYQRQSLQATEGDICPICVQERDNFGGDSVMVWAGIMGTQRTDLAIVPDNLYAVGYANILRNNLHPFMQNRGPGVILLHDNARPHTARVTTQFWLRTPSTSCRGRRFRLTKTPYNTCGTSLGVGCAIIIKSTM